MSLITMRSAFASSSRLAHPVPSLNARRSYLTSICAGRVPASFPHLTPSSLSTRGYAATNAPEPKSSQSTTGPEPAKVPTAAELAAHKKKQLLAAEAMKVRMRKARATGQDVRDPKAISTITSQPWPLFKHFAVERTTLWQSFSPFWRRTPPIGEYLKTVDAKKAYPAPRFLEVDPRVPAFKRFRLHLEYYKRVVWANVSIKYNAVWVWLQGNIDDIRFIKTLEEQQILPKEDPAPFKPRLGIFYKNEQIKPLLQSAVESFIDLQKARATQIPARVEQCAVIPKRNEMLEQLKAEPKLDIKWHLKEEPSNMTMLWGRYHPGYPGQPTGFVQMAVGFNISHSIQVRLPNGQTRQKETSRRENIIFMAFPEQKPNGKGNAEKWRPKPLQWFVKDDAIVLPPEHKMTDLKQYDLFEELKAKDEALATGGIAG